MRILFVWNLILASGLAQDLVVTAAVGGPRNTIFEAGVKASTPFVRQLDSHGEIVFFKLLPFNDASPNSIVVTTKGEPIVGGQLLRDPGDSFPATPGAYLANRNRNSGFLVKLDASGERILLASRGLGSNLLALDGQDNIYVAGASLGSGAIQPSANAFQPTVVLQACGGSGLVGIPCAYQYIAKLNADGTRLIYATYLAGTFGAQPSVLHVDEQGNAILAGRTHSEDYPTTPGTLQPSYRAAKRRPSIGFRPAFVPPAPSGYVTKLNASGSTLIWSTYFSGTGADAITRIRKGEEGTLILAGHSVSLDLPGAQTLPAACAFSYEPQVPFVAQITDNGAVVVRTRYLYREPDSLPATIDPASATPYLCITDAADNSFLDAVSSNQLISIHGVQLGDAPVTANREAVSTLYRAETQINLRVPESASQAGDLEIRIGDDLVRSVGVKRHQSSAFLDLSEGQPPNYSVRCNGREFGGVQPIARNEDGRLNTCANPAVSGSVVTLFLNGISSPPSQATVGEAGEVIALEPDPDSPQGVWRLKIRLGSKFQSNSVTPLMDGVPLRYPNLAVWAYF